MRLNVSSIVDKLTNLRNCELYSLFYFFLSLDQNINCYVTLYYIKSKIIRDVEIVGNFDKKFRILFKIFRSTIKRCNI